MRLLDGEAKNLARKTTDFHSEQIMRAHIAMKIVKRETGVCYTERCKITRPAFRLATPQPITDLNYCAPAITTIIRRGRFMYSVPLPQPP